ncbi:MAG: type II toxin-antitoxin system VapB family antitoxin [Beijerinckiaceae bacterium]|nr:type II toxin-antitoxin system VapB family antitoxin [Beijerinckiaceae bacterium]
MLNIRDPRAHELARKLAAERKSTITEAVVTALEHELERVRAAIPLPERLARIADDLKAQAGPNPRDVTRAEIDDMWTR